MPAIYALIADNWNITLPGFKSRTKWVNAETLIKKPVSIAGMNSPHEILNKNSYWTVVID